MDLFMDAKLYTTKEVAKILGITYTTMRNRIKNKQIPYININKGGIREIIRFDEKVIDGIINGK